MSSSFFKNTTFSQAKVGQKCNIETDMIGKYIEKLMTNSSDNKKKKSLTVEWMQNQGF